MSTVARAAVVEALVAERFRPGRLPPVIHSPPQPSTSRPQARAGTVTPWTAPDSEVIERRQRVLCGDEPQEVDVPPAERDGSLDELLEEVHGG